MPVVIFLAKAVIFTICATFLCVLVHETLLSRGGLRVRIEHTHKIEGGGVYSPVKIQIDQRPM